MRIAGVNIPDNKRLDTALSYIHGVGRVRAVDILNSAKIDFAKKAKDLTPEELNKVQSFIEKNYRIEGELRQDVKQNISRLKDIKCYKGVRHSKSLPVRGQRTRTNTRTRRGNVRRTAGSGRRKVEKK